VALIFRSFGGSERRDATGQQTTRVEHFGIVTAYATGMTFFAHAVANQRLNAMIDAFDFRRRVFAAYAPWRIVESRSARQLAAHAPDEFDDTRALQRASRHGPSLGGA
jgi:hypothetical protein